MDILLQVGQLLLENADLIEEVVNAVKSGTPKDAIKAAIRAAKVQVSDAAFKEELGL